MSTLLTTAGQVAIPPAHIDKTANWIKSVPEAKSRTSKEITSLVGRSSWRERGREQSGGALLDGVILISKYETPMTFALNFSYMAVCILVIECHKSLHL